MKYTLLSLLLCTLFLSTTLLAETITIPYQGNLTRDKRPLEGQFNFRFALFNSPADADSFWSCTMNNLTVTNGKFGVKLQVEKNLLDKMRSDTYLEVVVLSGPGITTPVTLRPRSRVYSSSPESERSKQQAGKDSKTTGKESNAGGQNNHAKGDHSTIGGGGGETPADSNSAGGGHSTIGGGSKNKSDGEHSSVGGGKENEAKGEGSSVNGGEKNKAGGSHSGVGGGKKNEASGTTSRVGGGTNNRARGNNSVVSGGGSETEADSNSAIGDYSAIGGGYGNIASGYASTVPGGGYNTAAGSHSLAMGRKAKALHDGSFVWSSDSVTDFNTTGAGQYLINAPGGVGIGTNTPYAPLDVNGGLRLYSTSYGYGMNITPTSNGISFGYSEPSGGAAHMTWYWMKTILQGKLGIGTNSTQTTNTITVVQNSSTDPLADAWTVYSSRRWKTNIETMKNALENVKKLRGVTFNWKEDGKHDIGLIAEEVGEVFPEIVAYEENGTDAKSVDYARLVSVLIEAVKEQQQQNEELINRITRLETLVQSLSGRQSLPDDQTAGGSR